MFKTFHAYLQTQQGEYPLTPRSSCCLLPLTLLIITPEIITNGGVITAIATTGLVVGLGVMLVVRKNLNSTDRIPQPIMIDQALFKENLENLERSLFLSLSNSEEKESFYREIAVSKNITVNEVREEVCFNELKITNFIRNQGKLHLEKKDAKEKLKLRWAYWLELNKIALKVFPLISPSINKYLKEYVQIFITSFNQANESHDFETYFYFLVKNSSSKISQENLEHYFLIEQTLLNCYQFNNYIDNQKDANQYIWHDYTIEEEAELLEEFITLYKKDVERDPTLKEDYKNSIESLEKTLSDLQSVTSIKQEDIHDEKQKKVSLEEQLTNFLVNSEEQIKIREQFKPPFPPKDDRTPEEIEEQIRKNQKLIDHYKKRIAARGSKTPEEIEQGRKAFERFQEIIREYR